MFVGEERAQALMSEMRGFWFTIAFAVILMIASVFTVIPSEGPPPPLEMPKGLSAFGVFADGEAMRILGHASFFVWIFTVVLMILDVVEPRGGVYSLYLSGCGIMGFADLDGAWWIPILIIVTVSVWYWFLLPLLLHHAARRRELNEW